jgi:hypothetical protein
MEKGFNDDELADIMNEIESLEQEFAKREPSLDDVAHSVVELAQSELDHPESDHSLLSEVAAMPVESIIPSKLKEEITTPVNTQYDIQSDTEEHHNIHPISSVNQPENPSEKTAKTAMNFSIEGDMKLDLSFLVSGQEINLHISEDGFEIELEGGAKFTLPVNTKSRGLKAA